LCIVRALTFVAKKTQFEQVLRISYCVDRVLRISYCARLFCSLRTGSWSHRGNVSISSPSGWMYTGYSWEWRRIKCHSSGKIRCVVGERRSSMWHQHVDGCVSFCNSVFPASFWHQCLRVDDKNDADFAHLTEANLARWKHRSFLRQGRVGGMSVLTSTDSGI